MRRTFGSADAGPARPLEPHAAELLRFYTAIHIALELWEPRLRSLRACYPPDQNSPETARQGRMGLRMRVQYLPNALQGDFDLRRPGRSTSEALAIPVVNPADFLPAPTPSRR